MKKIRLVVLSFIFVFLGTGLVHALEVNIITRRMADGFPNKTIIYDHVYVYETPYLQVSAVVPQIANSLDSKWQEAFNQSLLDNCNAFIQEIEGIAQENGEYHGRSSSFPYELLVDYEIKLNHGGLISLVIRSYYYTGGAHGMTIVDYVNVDLTTGHPLSFSDLFNTEKDLEYVLQVINKAVVAEPDRYLIQEFTADLLNSDQDFYLQEDQVVVCFGLYELAPYVSGIQEFTIPTP